MSGKWVRCVFLILVTTCGLARAQTVCHPLYEGDPNFGGTPPDSCDPTDGQIVVGYNWVPDPVPGLALKFQWEQEQGMASFNLYRGRLRALSDGNHDGALDSYGTCIAENMPDTVRRDTSIPPVGDAYIFIVSGNGAAGESGFGAASNGVPRPNAFPCATTVGKPTIEDVQVIGGNQEAQAVCDWTQILKGYLCNGGIAANQFAHFPTISLTVGYSAARLEALVVDPDSTPAQSDVASVTTQYVSSLSGTSPVVQSDTLLDDGSTLVTPTTQVSYEIMEDCSSDPLCPTCNPARYPLTSGDQVSRDDRYSKTYSFVSSDVRFDSPPGVTVNSRKYAAFDCIMQAKNTYPLILDYPVGAEVAFDIEAVDRSGFITWSPEHPSMLFRQTHFRCDGDECACCVLMSVDPAHDCVDRPGLIGVPGSGFETGLCVAFF